MVDLQNLKREGIDLAIRWGTGDWNDASIECLFVCPASLLPKLGYLLLQMPEGRTGGGQKLATPWRKRDAAGQAIKDRKSQFCLKLAHLMTHGALRQVKLIGC